MPRDDERLKECPVCGGDGERVEKEDVHAGPDRYRYECKECGNEWTA